MSTAIQTIAHEIGRLWQASEKADIAGLGKLRGGEAFKREFNQLMFDVESHTSDLIAELSWREPQAVDDVLVFSILSSFLLENAIHDSDDSPRTRRDCEIALRMIAAQCRALARITGKTPDDLGLGAYSGASQSWPERIAAVEALPVAQAEAAE